MVTAIPARLIGLSAESSPLGEQRGALDPRAARTERARGVGELFDLAAGLTSGSELPGPPDSPAALAGDGAESPEERFAAARDEMLGSVLDLKG